MRSYVKVKNENDRIFIGVQALIALGWAIVSGRLALCLGGNNQVLIYVFFELALFTGFFIDAIIVVMKYRKRALLYQRNNIIIGFGIVSLIGAVYSIVTFKDNAFEIILTLLSLVISFPTLLDFVGKDNLKVMPMIFSDSIRYDPDPIIDLSQDANVCIKVKNFNDTDMSVAFLGLFSESQWEKLKGKTKSWRTDYYVKKLDVNDGILIKPIKYKNVSAYGESNARFFNLKDLINSKKELDSKYLYFVYIDIFYRLHEIKFQVENDIEAEKDTPNAEENNKNLVLLKEKVNSQEKEDQ